MKFTLYTEETDERPIFITGNFNVWNPKDSRYQLSSTDPNNYYIEIADELLPMLSNINSQKAVGKT